MEWTESISKTIKFLEDNLLNTDKDLDVSKIVGVSSFYLQKGFKFMTGYSIAEYVRNRRLYLAALDVIANQEKVIDIAFKYGYDTPESFTKAFTRFHGVSPMQLRKERSNMQVFLPLKIKIEIQGGNEMDYVIEKMSNFKVIGFEKEFSFETSYKEIPQFWDEICQKYIQPMMKKEKPETDIEKAIADNCIGEFGVCIDDTAKEGTFRYMVAGRYNGGDVPEGMIIYELPDMEWAKFACKGPMPGALQAVNTKIFKEWLPNNPDFEIAIGANIEWYSKQDTKSVDYESAIWIPVKRKK